eukprot:1348149-Prymnesium_polylepis.1
MVTHNKSLWPRARRADLLGQYTGRRSVQRSPQETARQVGHLVGLFTRKTGEEAVLPLPRLSSGAELEVGQARRRLGGALLRRAKQTRRRRAA